MSTFVPPVSWVASPRYLEDAMTVVPGTPSRTIWFQEVEPDISIRNARLSQQVGSAAQMSFWVNQNAIENAGLCAQLTKSILGGYTAATNKKRTPFKHPFFPGMWAKDIIECVSVSTQTSTNGQYWGNYNVCKITVSFESLNFPVDISGYTVYNPNWMEIKVKSGSNRVSIPVGWYEFDGGGWDGFPASFGMWSVQPYTQIEMNIYQCTQNQVFGATAQSIKPLGSTFVGQVNNSEFGTCGIGTLLLDSIEANPWSDWLGNRLYNVRLNLIYNDWGWNYAPAADGSINKLKYVVGGGLPFPQFTLTGLINGLNPL